jgi:hypothetical protein
MKLSLIFLVMDLLTLLAYPIVFVYSKLYPYLKPKERIKQTNLLVIVPIASER